MSQVIPPDQGAKRLADIRASRRLAICTAIATSAGTLAYVTWQMHGHYSDFSQIIAAAKALLEGQSPYNAVGPGRPFEWSFPLLYPLPAIVFAVPFSFFSFQVADGLVVGVFAFALAWALTRDRIANPQLWVFASAAYVTAWHVSQWSPLLTAAALMPALGAVFACKPTVSAALWLAYPNQRSLMLAAGFAALSSIAYPLWLPEWRDALKSTSHMAPPLMHVYAGGPLLLLALLRWRRPEARLLTVLSLIPQTLLLYEAVPLFLIVRRWYEGVVLVVLTYVALAMGSVARDDYNAWLWTTGDHIILWVYLPCLVMVLLRPNEGLTLDLPAFRNGLWFWRPQKSV